MTDFGEASPDRKRLIRGFSQTPVCQRLKEARHTLIWMDQSSEQKPGKPGATHRFACNKALQVLCAWLTTESLLFRRRPSLRVRGVAPRSISAFHFAKILASCPTFHLATAFPGRPG